MNKIIELDSIRGLAALLIVIFHIPRWNPALDFPIVYNAYLVVELFFVISGFVIYRSYSDRVVNTKEFVIFQFLRFWRLYPVHILFLIVFMAIEICKWIAQSHFGVTSPNRSALSLDDGISAAIQHLFMIQAIGPTGDVKSFAGPVGIFNVPSWSISVEFYTCIFFGLFNIIFKRLRVYVYLFIFLIAIYLLATHQAFGFSKLLACLAGFSLGCLSAIMAGWKCRLFPKYSSLLAFILLIIFLISSISEKWEVLIYPLSSILIVTIVASDGGPLNYLLSLKPLTWLGKVSYSMYMSHYAISWIANQIVRFIVHPPELMLGGKSTPMLSIPQYAIAFLLYLLTVIFISHIVFQYIENPVRNWSRIRAAKF